MRGVDPCSWCDGECDDRVRGRIPEQFPKLVSLAAALTGRRDLAHELAQETMLRAHRHWDEIAGYDAPGAWCRRVLVNLAIDQRRSAAAVTLARGTSAGRVDQVDIVEYPALLSPGGRVWFEREGRYVLTDPFDGSPAG